jgi:hypothetical protein
MRTLEVVVSDDCQHGPKMLLVQDDDLVKALAAQSPDHSLRDGVHVRRQLRGADIFCGKTPCENVGEVLVETV